MKRTDQEHLLKEILNSEETADFREVSLNAALSKHRQRQRSQARLGIGTAMAIAGLLAWKFSIPQHKSKTITPSIQLAKTESPVPVATESKVKMISDAELLALFPNRPVALIGKPGHQRLIFLDEPTSQADGSL